MVQNLESTNSPIPIPHPTTSHSNDESLLTLEDVIDSQYLGESNPPCNEKAYYQSLYSDNLSRLSAPLSPGNPSYGYQHMNALYLMRQGRSYNPNSQLLMSPTSPQFPMQGIPYPINSGWGVGMYAPSVYHSQSHVTMDTENSPGRSAPISIGDSLRNQYFSQYPISDSSNATVYNSYPPTFSMSPHNHAGFSKSQSNRPRILVTSDLNGMTEMSPEDTINGDRRSIKKEAAESPPLDTSSTLHSPAILPATDSSPKPKKEKKQRSDSTTPKHKAQRDPNAAPKPKTIACPHPGCNKVFSRLYNMRTHTEIHSPNRTKDHACPECGLAFSRRHDMYRHQRNIHKNTTRPNQ